MLRIAVIGAGGFAFHIIQRIWDVADKLELVAVTSNPARKTSGAAVCRERGVNVFDTVEQLLDAMRGRCELIYIPTPIHTHAPLARKCLDAGFDVWMEKPPVATIQDHDDLMAYARKHGRQIAVCFQYLYNPLVQAAKEAISAGKYGRVARVRSIAAWERFDSYFARNSWGGKLRAGDEWVLDGTINNPLAHVLSNNLYLASMDRWGMADPSTVQAELYHGHDIESEDTSSLRVVTTEGVEVTYQATLCAEEVCEPITVVDCEKATIEYAEFTRLTVTYRDGVREQSSYERDRFVTMLERLASDYENDRPYPGSLEVCRPFTLAVNGAFESSRLTHGIEKDYIHRFDQDGEIKTTVEGLQGLMQQAYQQGKVLSELGAPWAVRTEPFDVTGYRAFPLAVSK
jgi:predicted dehydrogenase